MTKFKPIASVLFLAALALCTISGTLPGQIAPPCNDWCRLRNDHKDCATGTYTSFVFATCSRCTGPGFLCNAAGDYSIWPCKTEGWTRAQNYTTGLPCCGCAAGITSVEAKNLLTPDGDLYVVSYSKCQIFAKVVPEE